MMGIPYSYSLRNLRTRLLTTTLTAAGMALVVFVFASVLMLSEGLRQTLTATGSYDNVVLIRKSSVSEVQSGVERGQASLLEIQPEVASGPDGRLMLAKEVVVLISLPKRDSGKPSNVTIRGIGKESLPLRPQVTLVQGRMPRPGSWEIATGGSIARRFRGADLGETLRFAMRDWRVVGIFEAGNTGFNSELWGDADQLMQAFNRPVYSSVIFRMRDPSGFQAFRDRIVSDPRLTVEPKREIRYYEEQSEMMSKFLNILGLSLSIIFSLGATIGAMITKYAAVATRTSEIGMLRALGFGRGSILAAFLLEALFLSLIGGLLGLFFASFMQLITVSTLNFQTFSELAFSFSLNSRIVAASLMFSLFMGFIGGFLPAVRAARMNIVEALRTG